MHSLVILRPFSARRVLQAQVRNNESAGGQDNTHINAFIQAILDVGPALCLACCICHIGQLTDRSSQWLLVSLPSSHTSIHTSPHGLCTVSHSDAWESLPPVETADCIVSPSLGPPRKHSKRLLDNLSSVTNNRATVSPVPPSCHLGKGHPSWKCVQMTPTHSLTSSK